MTSKEFLWIPLMSEGFPIDFRLHSYCFPEDGLDAWLWQQEDDADDGSMFQRNGEHYETT